MMLRGARTTILLTVLSAGLTLIMAFLAGLARSSKNRVVLFGATVYIEVFRGISLLIQLFWIFFALPLVGIRFSRFTAGILALGLNMGAYGAEIVRGAITAVPKAQREAAVALNFSPVQRMLYVIFPQAAVRMLPPFGNLLIELLKATSLVSLISITELTFTSYTLRTAVGRTFEVFTILLILYFLLSRPIAWGVKWVERRRQWAL
jgi:polar amino acid transport system permease protein